MEKTDTTETLDKIPTNRVVLLSVTPPHFYMYIAGYFYFILLLSPSFSTAPVESGFCIFGSLTCGK